VLLVFVTCCATMEGLGDAVRRRSFKLSPCIPNNVTPAFMWPSIQVLPHSKAAVAKPHLPPSSFTTLPKTRITCRIPAMPTALSRQAHCHRRRGAAAQSLHSAYC